MKSTLEDEKLKDKISDADRETISKKCDEIIKWLDANQLAEEEEFKDKQKEVEAVCNPIITKLYQSAGVPPGLSQLFSILSWPHQMILIALGGMPGGMPGAGGASSGGTAHGGSGSGPTIEEVD